MKQADKITIDLNDLVTALFDDEKCDYYVKLFEEHDNIEIVGVFKRYSNRFDMQFEECDFSHYPYVMDE